VTGDDLQRIEAALEITLPEPYKRLVGPFPVPYLRGNADTDLWDDAGQLVARNRELRTEFVRGRQPWPSHWFFIGDPQTACGNAIDLRDPGAPLVWVDHCDLRSIEGASGQPFEEWLREWTAAIRADLEGDGIDPNGDPPAPAEPSQRWKRVLVFTVLVLCLGGLALFGAVSAVRGLIR
jgi:hypothetical protein